VSRREAQALAALEGALPWMVLLGDHIGNGTRANPDGRCDAILAMREAIATLTEAQAVGRVRDALSKTVWGRGGVPCWYDKPEINGPINEGVKRGWLFRPSVTQVELTCPGAAAFEAHPAREA